MSVGLPWLLWLVVGALGGLATTLATAAVRNAYHQRVRKSAHRRQAQSAEAETAPHVPRDEQPPNARDSATRLTASSPGTRKAWS
jgi:hypothetical protein